MNFIDYYYYYEDFLFKTNEWENVNQLLEDFIIYDINIRLPKKVKYELEINAKIKNENEIKTATNDLALYDHCLTYKINADFKSFKEFEVNDLSYPIVSDLFISKQCQIIEPNFYYLTDYFSKNKNIIFSFKIPDAINVGLIHLSLDPN